MRILSAQDEAVFNQLMILAGGDLDILRKALAYEETQARQAQRPMDFEALVNTLLEASEAAAVAIPRTGHTIDEEVLWTKK